MPPFDGDLPGAGVFGQKEPIRLTGKLIPDEPQGPPKYPGVICAWTRAGEYIPQKRGAFLRYLDVICKLMEHKKNKYDGWAYGSNTYIGQDEYLDCSARTIERYTQEALKLGLIRIQGRAGRTDLRILTTKGMAFRINRGRAMTWRGQNDGTPAPERRGSRDKKSEDPRQNVGTYIGQNKNNSDNESVTEAPRRKNKQSVNRETTRPPSGPIEIEQVVLTGPAEWSAILVELQQTIMPAFWEKFLRSLDLRPKGPCFALYATDEKHRSHVLQRYLREILAIQAALRADSQAVAS